MRVISGEARRRKLITPKGEHTRPTADMVKESVFNIIQTDVFEAQVLDMFCGSGQMGIEALSRGALNCLFLDNSKEAVDVTKKNLAICGFESRGTVVQCDAYQFLKGKKEAFDLVFLDPPYEQGVQKALQALFGFDILRSGGIIVCETKRGETIEVAQPPHVQSGVYHYGKTSIHIITKE